MGIKSTVNDGNAKSVKPFPKLMKSDKTHIILLAVGIGDDGRIHGFALNEAFPSTEIGRFSDGWDRNCFTDFSGSVTLQNE